jgi:hypothetical protein
MMSANRSSKEAGIGSILGIDPKVHPTRSRPSGFFPNHLWLDIILRHLIFFLGIHIFFLINWWSYFFLCELAVFEAILDDFPEIFHGEVPSLFIFVEDHSSCGSLHAKTFSCLCDRIIVINDQLHQFCPSLHHRERTFIEILEYLRLEESCSVMELMDVFLK